MGLSNETVKKYLKINNNVDQEILNKFDKNEININVMEKIAKVPINKQTQLYNEIHQLNNQDKA